MVTGEVIVVKKATCAEEGVAHMFCTSCGEIVNTVSIPKTNEHIETSISSMESTCTQKGLTEGKKCSVCEKTLVPQTEIPLKAHTEEVIPAVESTCAKNGLTEGKKCSACGEILVVQEESPLKTHTYDNDSDATCNFCGYERYCLHHNTTIIEGREATCTATGLTDGEKCADCGEMIIAQEVINIKSHDEVIDPKIEATCTSTGLTEGKHCSACGTITVAQTVIDITPHTFGEWTLVRESTTTEEGLKERYCECGEKDTQVIEKNVYSEGLEYRYCDNWELDGICEYNQFYFVEGIGTCTDTEIIIPSTYNDYPVKIIDLWAFKDCNFIESVIIPDSIVIIDEGAFLGCTSLKNVEIPESVIYISASVFANCPSLREINIPNSVVMFGHNIFGTNNNLSYNEYHNGLYIGNKQNPYIIFMKAKDTSITDCIIHPNTKFINASAFENCKYLTDIILPNSIVGIDSFAFYGCSSLRSVVVPEGVTSIREHTFSGCALDIIVLPNSLNEIYMNAFPSVDFICYNGSKYQWDDIYKHYYGSYVFDNCAFCFNNVALPPSNVTIEMLEYSLNDDNASYTITGFNLDNFPWYPVYLILPSTYSGLPVTNVAGYFGELTNIFISYGITAIGDGDFMFSGELESVYIPNTVTYIGEKPFSYSPSLTCIVFGGRISEWFEIEKATDWDEGSNSYIIYCTDGQISKDGTITYYDN